MSVKLDVKSQHTFSLLNKLTIKINVYVNNINLLKTILNVLHVSLCPCICSDYKQSFLENQ